MQELQGREDNLGCLATHAYYIVCYKITVALPRALLHVARIYVTPGRPSVRCSRREIEEALSLPLGLVLIVLLLACDAVQAQQPAPAGMSLAEAAARRFPQPVRVEDLIGRQVLRPLESQPTLGRVRDVVTQPDNSIGVVMNYRSVFGLSARPIVVPLEAMVLLGEYVDVIDFTPEQLNRFPTFDGSGAIPLPPGSIIRVGLARPSH